MLSKLRSIPVTFMHVFAGAAFICIMILLLAFRPDPLFGYTYSYGLWTVYSDQPIDKEIEEVLDDAERRLSTSSLYTPEDRFRIYICNATWRLWFTTRSTDVGGAADTIVSRNIFLRESDIRSNRLIPPRGELADEVKRPLSYFIAHEAAHILQSRRFGRLIHFRPQWLREGHADLIAKADDFDLDENLQLWMAGDHRLSYDESGLYREFHLLTLYMTEIEGWSYEELYKMRFTSEDVRARMKGATIPFAK